MFRPDLCNPLRFPQVIDAAKRSRQQLERLNQIVYGDEARESTETILWSHVHGLSCLLVDGPLANQFEDEQQAEAHLSAVSQKFADLVLGSSRRLV